MFQDGDAQVQHFLDEHECIVCGYLSDNSALKKQHFSEEHAICDDCGEVFEYKFYKEDHIEQKHKADNKVATTCEQSTSDQKTSEPRAGRKHRKVCSIQ